MIETIPVTQPAIVEHRLRREVLSLTDTLAQSVTVMAPAMSGGFITYLAAVKAGGATPLAFVLATLACLLIGTVVSEFARTIRSAGSLYTYTVHGLGPFWGFLMGWGYLFALFLVGPAVLAGASVFLSMVMGNLGAPNLLTHWWLWFGAGLAGWFALAYPGVRLTNLVLLAVAFDAFFCGLAASNAATRTMFAMGRDRMLPPVLSRTHPRYQTPYVALAAYLAGAVIFAVVLIALTSGATRDGIAGGGGRYASGLYVFVEGLSIITPPVMLAYALVSIAGIAYGMRKRKPALAVASIGALGGAGVAVFGSLYYSFVEAAPGAGIPTPYRVIPWAVLGWVVIGGLVAGWLRWSRRATWEGMGTIFE